ncbi:hypothetical protein C0993_007268 [Termitomyces sp. T159_Od127]|nr:hypothetical protein C0993_007268 [Termitomyces sp. T159_Od127]
MSTNGGSSENEESQASQVLHAMLNPEIDSRKTGETCRLRQGNDVNVTRTVSPSRFSSPLYHDFHGLGQTQTQYLDEELELNESSQKENIEVARDEQLQITATLATNTPHAGLSSYDVTKPRSIAVKAVSFQSPKKRTTPTFNDSVQRQSPQSTTTLNLSHGHVDSPVSSQDSFGLLDQDPSHQFLATSKQFNVPLSELPKVVLPHAAVPSTRSSLDYTYSRHQKHHRSPSPSEGTILVESTPSASGGSQSQSYPDVQRSEVLRNLPSGQSRYVETSRPTNDAQNTTHHPIEECLSDAPSSFYADHNDDSLPSTALAPTQPSTQLEDNDTMEVEPVHPFDAVVNEATAYTGNTSSTATTNARSLFNMVDPKKRYRYQHLIQPQKQLQVVTESSLIQTEDKPPSTLTAHRSPIPKLTLSLPLQAQSQTSVETRLSFNEQSRQPGQQHVPSRLQQTNHSHEPSRREETGSHGINVVPDSEPPQDDVLERNRSMSEGPSGLSINVSCFGNNVQEIARSFDDDDQKNLLHSGLLPLRGKRHTAAAAKGKGTFAHDHDLGKRPDSRQERRSSAGRSNQEATLIPPIPHLDVPVPTANVRTTRASAALSMYRPPGTVQSWNNGVVPSSIPNEGTSNAGVKPHANDTGSKKGKGTASNTRVGSKRTPAFPSKRTRRRAELNAEPSSLLMDNEILSQAGNIESDSTEPADDINMDPDFGGTTSRKRKRGGSSAKSTKSKSKKVKKSASATPSARQPNRLRSMTSASRISDVAPTRVFALWKQDSCYYSGSVYADVGGGMYEVHFDDRTSAHVHIDQMRALDLRVNDDVMIPNIMRGFKVNNVDKLASSQLVGVCLDEGLKDMELTSLRIAAKTISAAWQDRTLYRHSIVPTIKSEPSRASPAPSGSSLATVPSRRSGRGNVFEKTAFVVSVSYNEREKENLLSRIKNNGGVIVNDWQDVLNMQGTYSMYNNRWVIRKEEAQWIGTESIARIFLVADHPSFKPKFLVALALGVPCLKVEWLYDTVTSGEEKNWLAYMLGQGFSEALSTQISQQVDINWGTSVHHLTDIMENRLKSKKLSIAEEKAKEAHNAITRIILAMGADRVEAVTEIDHASAPLEEFDFVVIKKVEHYSLELGMVPYKTVHWNWVKECLVASRLLPQPEWGLDSQEA